MAYLGKEEYTLRIAVSHLDEILEQAAETTGLTTTNILDNAESWARAYVKSYLDQKYNMDVEFGYGVGSASRSPLIMQVVMDLVLCTIHKTINPRDMPDHIKLACDDATVWLLKAQDGKVLLTIPKAPLDADGVELDNTYLNSQPKFVSKPYQDLDVLDDTN